MKVSMFPFGRRGARYDAIAMMALYSWTAVVAVPVGYLVGIGVVLPASLAILIGSVTGGYVIAHGTDAHAPIRGLSWMALGTGVAFLIAASFKSVVG